MIDYTTPGPLTDLSTMPPAALAGLADDPVGICRPVRHLVLQPAEATASGLPEARFAENQLRPAARLVDVLLGLDPAPLVQPRPEALRVVGTCRHPAVLACALLRSRGIPSRVRCGFATYSQPGLALDHWIVEHRDAADTRWVRLDPEVLGAAEPDRAADLPPGDFLDGAQAWDAYRRGQVDATTFGVHGTENFGPAEIRGNHVKDLAAVVEVEMLPWDEWGRMTEAYESRTGPDYDALLDVVAATLLADDADGAVALHRSHPELTVPADLQHRDVDLRPRRPRSRQDVPSDPCARRSAPVVEPVVGRRRAHSRRRRAAGVKRWRTGVSRPSRRWSERPPRR